jgi:hypothetical protein
MTLKDFDKIDRMNKMNDDHVDLVHPVKKAAAACHFAKI